MTSKFKPLKEGSIFKGKIRFFNLRKAELGALLSSLTFHGMSLENENLFFNIGYAKPRGYGRVLIKIKFEKIEEYVKHFELEMRSKFSNWNNSEAIKELFSMSILNDATENKLKYLELKYFQILKNQGLTLLPYSQLNKNFNKNGFKLYVNQNELDQFKEVKEKNKLEYIKKQNEAARAKEQVKAAEEAEYKRVLTEGTVQEIEAMLQKYSFGEKAEALANKKNVIIEAARIQAEALALEQAKVAEEAEYQRVLTKGTVQEIDAMLQKYSFGERADILRRRKRELTANAPVAIPESLRNPNLALDSFLNTAARFKNEHTKEFEQYKEEIKSFLEKNTNFNGNLNRNRQQRYDELFG
jgi:hypothetical protein